MKKLQPCIRCHNSDKQRRILTKFNANTDTLNGKQVTKFKSTVTHTDHHQFSRVWSTSATATASLVRSLKCKVSNRYRRDWLSSVRPCKWQDVRSSEHLNSVFKMSKKCPPCAQTQAPRRGRHCLTASSMTTWWKCSHSVTLRSGATSAGRRQKSGCGTHVPAASPKSGSRLG